MSIVEDSAGGRCAPPVCWHAVRPDLPVRARSACLGTQARAIELAVGQVVAGLPWVERRGLGARMRREVTTLLLNLARGCARADRAGRLHHLSMARGALAALEEQVESARRLRYLTHASGVHLERGCDRLARLLGREVLSLHAGLPSSAPGRADRHDRPGGAWPVADGGGVPDINEI